MTSIARPSPKPSQAPRPGRPRDPELADRRREQILRAATRLFAKHGFESTDLQDVADALKVGKGTLYRYFPTKRDLFQAAVDRVMDEMRGHIDAASAAIADPIDRIATAIRAYLEFFHDHPSFVELLIQERAAFRDRSTPTYFAYREAHQGRWHAAYRELIAQGRMRDLPLDRITNVLGDLVYGTMFTNHVARRDRSLVEQADDILDLVFRGLLTPAELARRDAASRSLS